MKLRDLHKYLAQVTGNKWVIGFNVVYQQFRATVMIKTNCWYEINTH